MRNLGAVVLLFICVFSVATAKAFTCWSDRGPAESNAGPAFGVYDDTLYLAMVSADRKHHIHVYKVRLENYKRAGILRKQGCYAGQRLPSRTSATPALTEYKGKLWMAFRSADSSGYIYYQSYDGYTWSMTKKTKFKTGAGPALVVYNDRLHMAWRENNGKQFYSASFDGKQWSVSEKLRADHSRRAPTLAVFDNIEAVGGDDSFKGIYLAYQRDGRATVNYAIRQRAGWIYPKSGLKVMTAFTPALAVHGAFNSRLYEAAVTRGDDCGQVIIRHMGYEYPRFRWQTGRDPDVRTCKRPALISFGEYLVLGTNDPYPYGDRTWIAITFWKPEDVG